jgi:probable phosphoglycerate mutase
VKLLLAHYMHLDVRRAVALPIENASVSIVGIDKEERSRVEAIGWTPRPGWLKLPLPQEDEKTPLAQETSQQQM